MNGLKVRLLFFSLLIGFYLLRLNLVSQQFRNLPNGAKVRFVARISQQPDLKNSKQIISLGRFRVITSRFPGYFYGQKIEVVGRLRKKMINRFKTEFIFDYPAIRLVGEKENLNGGFRAGQALINFRGQIERRILELLPEPQASLLLGILLGARRQVSPYFLNNLRKTGTIHVVVASGYNLTVVAGFLLAFLVRLMKRKKALLFAFLVILAYTFMVGAEPPIVRAAIMGSLTYLAQFCGREKDVSLVLIFAAALMLLISPLILFDLGFQLSFLAAAGILFLEPKLRARRFFQLPVLGENLAVTLAAQLGVLPILLANFGQISFLSPLINALVLPAVPLIMGLGAVLTAASFVFHPLAVLLSWFVWVPLTYFITLVNWFAKVPWATLSLAKISGWWTIGYYLVLILWLIKKQKPLL